MIHFSLKEYYRSFSILNELIRNSPDPSEKSFYGCARDIIGATTKGLSKNDCTDLLGFFYESDMIGRIYRILLEKEYFFKNLFGPNCFDCTRCGEYSDCHFNSIRRITKSVKKQYALSKINQNELERSF
jgi:hypothetical protein